jgi:hypothetical protein
MATPPENITFLGKAVTYYEFFSRNGLFDIAYKNCEFKLIGAGGDTITLFITKQNGKNILYNPYLNGLIDLSSKIIQTPEERGRDGGLQPGSLVNDKIVGLKIIKPVTFILAGTDGEQEPVDGWEETYGAYKGGRKASVKKEICGVMRCIYKISGSRKEHIKYKGRLITVADYKKLMKNKA